MIHDNQILDAINCVTREVFPGRLTYREAMPEKFQRPSLFLGHEPRTLVRRSGFLAEYRGTYYVQILAQVDEHYEARTDELNDELYVLSAAFDASLPVADRHLHIEKMTVDRAATMGSVSLTLHWYEYHPAVRQADGETAAHAAIAVACRQ